MVGFYTLFLFLINLQYSLAQETQKAPPFSLLSSQEKEVSLSSYKGQYVILEWINYDCPFVKRHYQQKSLPTLQKKVIDLGHQWFAICSSAPHRQGYFSTKEINHLNFKNHFNGSAYLIDKNGVVARQYKAKVTPFIVVIAPNGNIVYTGGVDEAISPSAPIYLEKTPLYLIIKKIEMNKKITPQHKKSFGCSIKFQLS